MEKTEEQTKKGRGRPRKYKNEEEAYQAMKELTRSSLNESNKNIKDSNVKLLDQYKDNPLYKYCKPTLRGFSFTAVPPDVLSKIMIGYEIVQNKDR